MTDTDEKTGTDERDIPGRDEMQDEEKELWAKYPPGPSDKPDDYAVLVQAAISRLLLPTLRFRDGHRIWQEVRHKYSLFDYPPGPLDDALSYGVLMEVADRGRIRPKQSVENGRRMWVVLGEDSGEKPN